MAQKNYPNRDYNFDADNFNDIFKRLEKLRAAHYAGNDAGSTARAQLADSFKTNVVSDNTRGEGENASDTSSPHNLLKNYLLKLQTSAFLSDKVSKDDIYNLEIPLADDLINANEYDNVIDMISKMEGEPSAYTNHHAGYSPTYTCNAHDNSANFDRRTPNNETCNNPNSYGNADWRNHCLGFVSFSETLFPNGTHYCKGYNKIYTEDKGWTTCPAGSTIAYMNTLS